MQKIFKCFSRLELPPQLLVLKDVTVENDLSEGLMKIRKHKEHNSNCYVPLLQKEFGLTNKTNW